MTVEMNDVMAKIIQAIDHLPVAEQFWILKKMTLKQRVPGDFVCLPAVRQWCEKYQVEIANLNK